jgi:tRNA(Ile)-lysidine synthase
VGPPRLAVAASGGRDSTALLHCAARQARAWGIEVVALHVHHGLMPGADRWMGQVRAQCRRWGVRFVSRRIAGAPGPGDSVEAWARSQRYRALAEMAHGEECDLVLLAHHRSDQAETWLLQALRGAGPTGLAAMPRSARRGGIVWVRPWLDQPRAAIDAYIRRHRLRHVEDDSNSDTRYARNRLRLAVWPALLGAFPDADVELCNAARRAQQAAALAAEMAAMDLPAVQRGAVLDVSAWLELPPARRRNALQAWLGAVLPAGTPGTLVSRLEAELPAVRTGRWPAPGAELRLHRGLLGVAAVAGPASDLRAAAVLDLGQPGEVALASWRGRFVVDAATRGGVAPELLRAVLARARRGQEQFRLAPDAAARSLKKQFQARGVPPWERHGPLLYTADGRLLFVPGLGIDAALLAPAGESQLALHWLADAPPAIGPKRPGR